MAELWLRSSACFTFSFVNISRNWSLQRRRNASYRSMKKHRRLQSRTCRRRNRKYQLNHEYQLMCDVGGHFNDRLQSFASMSLNFLAAYKFVSSSIGVTTTTSSIFQMSLVSPVPVSFPLPLKLHSDVCYLWLGGAIWWMLTGWSPGVAGWGGGVFASCTVGLIVC